MLLGSFSTLAGAEDVAKVQYEYNTAGVQTLNYLKGYIIDEVVVENDKEVTKYVKGDDGKEIVIDTALEKLDTMDLRLEANGHRMYVDAYTGEIAVQNVLTGEAIFTNPFNVGISKATDSIKAQLLSQLAVKYTDIKSGSENTYYSFTEASQRGQIKVKNIKGGLRVEYTIGREQAKILVPIMMEANDFEEQILNPIKEALGEKSYDFGKFNSFFLKMDKSAYSNPETLASVLKVHPLMNKMVYYRLDEKASEVDKLRLEQYIKTYVPDFTFEDLDEAHMKTEYQAEDTNPPLFKMALEYTLEEDGVNVRLPANGIRFNESLYRVESIDILPYMGAASSEGEGYNFFPDGSGAIFDFGKIQDLGITTTITGKVYGQDYAYHTISGTHQEIIRYPVYGIVGSNVITIEEEEEVEGETPAEGTEGETAEGETGEDEIVLTSLTLDEETDEAAPANDIILIAPNPNATEATTTTTTTTTPVDINRQSGFVAIVEEGDAMMEITSYHETQAHEYNTVRVTVYPRPQDSYNLSNAISVGAGGEWTVVSSRKYTGSYRIKYILLTPDDVAASKGMKDYYECSYVGMAYAYRDYLVNKGILTRLTEADVKEDIPLYIETFGALETVERFLSIPVTVLTPLTTFEDIKTMYADLKEEGITNVNFKLTGFANGGMVSTVPYHLDWEKSVGGKKGFEDLIAYATEEGFGVYPDFDFVYIDTTGSFDGLNLKKHAVKTIDNRYTSRREYSGTKQTYIGYFELAMSPAYFSRFYEKLTENYLEYNPLGISVGTLGSDLNSDFDKKEPYNREDAKEYTMNAFEYLDNNYKSVMTSAGNAFTWKYVDHITDVALDSSQYAQAAAAVPFLGIVLHGYVQIAGEPINMEGNTSYSLLKAIESGAGLNFLLSYRNTDNLKEDEVLSKYYSVRYDIWFDDVISLYKELNGALADVQTSIIVDHDFIDGVRVPDADELAADAALEIEKATKAEAERLAAAEEAARRALMNARLDIQKADNNISSLVDTLNSTIAALTTDKAGKNFKDVIDAYIKDYKTVKAELDVLTAELEALKAVEAPDAEAVAAKEAEVAAKQKAVDNAYANIDLCYYNTKYNANLAMVAYLALENAALNAENGYALLEENKVLSDVIMTDLAEMLKTVSAIYDENAAKRDEILAHTDAMFAKVEGILEGATAYEAPAPEETVATETVVEEEVVPAKYKSDDNMIVLVKYENGISFLLNFNNYNVKVELDGTVYTLDAYGYLIFDERNQ